MIQAYPGQASIFPGDTLTLHVSTDQPQFRVEFYRQGKLLEFKDHADSKTWKPGRLVPKKAANDKWDWPGYEFSIPRDWPSGVYVAMLFESDPSGKQISAPENLNSTDGRDAKALFVIKSAAPGRTSRILYKVPLFTYQAYNAEGEPWGSLYQPKVYQTVTLQRPGGGTGGSPYDTPIPDYYDPSTPRQTFAHWDALFISWLETTGYVVDYCTDLDVHQNSEDFLDHYALMLSVGHDEYWSHEMRTHVEAAIRQGLNVAFFSGNTCFRRVSFDDDVTFGHRIEWHKVKDTTRRQSRPENTLTGVSYRNGGGRWTGQREPIGYTVQYTDHWIYEGTGLRDGDTFGKEQHLYSTCPMLSLCATDGIEEKKGTLAGYVIGYEFDGASLRDQDGLLVPTGKDGTPPTFTVLGVGRISTNKSDDFPRWHNNWAEAEIYGEHTATMGLYSKTGIVFTASTTDWARVLAAGEPTVDRITRNVLDRLQARGVRIYADGESADESAIVKAVEGQDITLHVNTEALPDQRKLRYAWTLSAGTALTLDQPTLRVRLPSPPVPVTLTVEVTDEAGYHGFGTLTIRPQPAAFATVPGSGITKLLATVKDRIKEAVGVPYDGPVGSHLRS